MTTTASVALDAAHRSTLERLVVRARILLEGDLADQAEGRFGIHLDGTIEDEAALPDDTTDKLTRRDLEQIVDHLRSLGEDPAGAVARMLREASFTHLNRLVAIRIAEAIGLLPESLANGPQSQGFKDVGEIMPMLAGDYRAYVRLCGDELAADAPALFDPRNPLLALEPSTATFESLVALMAGSDAAEIWSAPDTLGWAYQFFNTGDERREMRESSAPRNSRELAVRNQFFTPRYVVDFLVQNSLGRRLIESDPTSALLDELPLLVDPPTDLGPTLNLAEVKCLDPACGSGHFLLGCYDVLERAWELAGTSAADAAPKIVAALWGVDIDPRCAQVASAAITLRARRHCRDLILPRPNIITARGLPEGPTAIPADLELTTPQRSLVARVSEVLSAAPLLGILLKAEDALAREIRHGAFGGNFKPGMLELSDEAAQTTERELLDQLQAIADEASSSVVGRLLAAEAHDALRLVEVVRQRYDVVLMNPPFGEPVPSTKPYLKSAYAWIPSTSDLFALFVGRGLELCEPSGYCGAIAPRSGLFLTSYEKWRVSLVEQRLATIADLGADVMEQALVESAAYVLSARPRETFTAIRLVREVNRESALADAISASRSGADDERVYTASSEAISSIPGVPLAYWMSSGVLEQFRRWPALEGTGASIRKGGWSGDDFRRVRLWWEVAGHRTAVDWVPYSKGGNYSPYFIEPHLVVAWDASRSTFLDYFGRPGRPTPLPDNYEFYFRPGLSWTRRTNAGFGVRVLPEGSVFSDKTCCAFAANDDHYLVLGWLNTRLVQACVDAMVAAAKEVASGGPSRSYEVGIAQRLPWPALTDEQAQMVRSHARRVAELRASLDLEDETTRSFYSPYALAGGPRTLDSAVDAILKRREAIALEGVDSSLRIEQEYHAALGLGADVEEYLDHEVGVHPGGQPDVIHDPVVATRYLTEPLEGVIDEAIEEHGGSRAIANLSFAIDRRLEVAAIALRSSPRVLVDLRQAKQLRPAGLTEQVSANVFSYLVGLSFGRWDVRVGLRGDVPDAPRDLLSPTAPYPPAMLLNAQGQPARESPPDYPLALPPGGILLDEPGHQWDVERRVVDAASVLFGDPASNELRNLLGSRTVREHMRTQFFKDHVTRYSRSRRRAPLYWPLSVPSKDWSAWIYAPWLSRETLYAVALEAGRRERLAVEAINQLQREQQEGGAGRPARKVSEELDAEVRLAEELRRFRAEAERIAGLGWEPNADDGAVLCAAPLADLLPSWPDATAARTELRKGKHEWATVAAWADQL